MANAPRVQRWFCPNHLIGRLGCRGALARVRAPPPSILGLLPPPFLIRMLVSLALGSVFPVLSLITSHGGNVSVFMEVTVALLWRLMFWALALCQL
ncbi:hypothetical protein Prudu_015515 [Prunus dulcis]|uniref:Uncharacterized protein n=1 Tax=Prunus dulcis TaxID=3755 RepID=A0A4Y1RJH2_PRUDU|nr:hypothetical protein Prudu_015515 [Prunus dulcis]